MTGQQLTGLVVASVIVLLIVYDILAYTFGGNSSTISWTLLQVSTDYRGFVPTFCFGLGYLCCHLFNLTQHQ